MNPCETCAFSDCGSDYYVCLECDDLKYKTPKEGRKEKHLISERQAAITKDNGKRG